MPIYRAANLKDAKRIALLHADSWRRTYRGLLSDEFLDRDVVDNHLEVWHDRLSLTRKDQFVIVAEDGDRISGFICMYGNEDRQWGSLIDNLHVEHTSKRQGIGRSLMQQASLLLDERYPEVGFYLWVMEANHAARCFYDRLGATNMGVVEQPNPAGGGSALLCRYVWSSPGVLIDR